MDSSRNCISDIRIIRSNINKKKVNDRVNKELPKVVKENPPILFFRGVLEPKLGKVSIYPSGSKKEAKRVMTYVANINCKELGITSLEPPVKFTLFIKNKYKNLEETEEIENMQKYGERNYKTPFNDYYYKIKNNQIEITYLGSEFSNDSPIYWALEVPNPSFRKSIS